MLNMQKIVNINNISEEQINALATKLKSGALAVLPTDTIYGIHGSALSPKTIERIYKIKNKETKKPLIILVSSLEDILKFEISLSENNKKFLDSIWPGKVSVILDCKSRKYQYLHHGFNTLAFRVPQNILLQKILPKSGPLISSSANLSSQPASTDIQQALKTFAKHINIFIDAGKISGLPSTIIKINDSNLEIIREGALSKRLLEKQYTLVA